MTTLADMIVYIWLLPVAAQIILPLAMLAFWLVGRPLYRLFTGPATDSAPAAALNGAGAKK